LILKYLSSNHYLLCLFLDLGLPALGFGIAPFSLLPLGLSEGAAGLRFGASPDIDKLALSADSISED
jgi:hypothetical protein